MKPKIFLSDNGTLTDVSNTLGNYHSLTTVIPNTAAQDCIFIGSRLPFNHIYIKISVANEEASVLSASLWDGDNWNAVAEIIDETSVGGKTLAQSGYITFVPDKYEGWFAEDTKEDNGTDIITGISGVNIYDMYWLRLNFSANLTATTALAWAGHLFSNDDDLGSEYPDLVLSTTMTAFEAGKTTWEEQHVRAAEIIVGDLKNAKAIIDSAQLLDYKSLTLASVSKVAEIIYHAFGSSHVEMKASAKADYKDRFSALTPVIDKNNDAIIDLVEIKTKSIVMSR